MGCDWSRFSCLQLLTRADYQVLPEKVSFPDLTTERFDCGTETLVNLEMFTTPSVCRGQ